MESNLEREQPKPALSDLLRPTEDLRQLRLGDIRPGVVRELLEDGVLIEVIPGQTGHVSPEDLEKLAPEERAALKEGQQVLVCVVALPGDGAEPMELSLHLARKEQDWMRAEELLRTGDFWQGEVQGYNKGGLIVYFGHIRGFVPASQVSEITRTMAREERLARLARMVGQTIPLRVIEVDRRQRRLILSERQGQNIYREWDQEQRFSSLRRGQILRGRVQSLVDYGAFVDLGGMTGLVHRTELAWFRVEHPCEILEEGQEVDVYVLRVNRQRRRISLSLKRTHPDPWSTVQERYHLKQQVEGRVIRRTGAGVFVLLDDGVLGILSLGELEREGHFAEEFALGQRVQARIVRIDGARRRLGLSLLRRRPETEGRP